MKKECANPNCTNEFEHNGSRKIYCSRQCSIDTFESNRIKRSIVYEDTQDPNIRQEFLKAFINRTYDAGYKSKNRNVKTNCITTKPQRGNIRYDLDKYLSLHIRNPNNPNEILHCLAHRIAAFLYISDLPDDKQALHICDIKSCCNPDHIYIGTDKENRIDYQNRRKEKTINGNLTRHEWESIKYWLAVGEHTATELAKHFNVGKQTIFRVPEFTTDGSEIIGSVFIPKIIPKAQSVINIEKSIEMGLELLQMKRLCKKIGWRFTWEAEEFAEENSITLQEGYRCMRLAKANPHRDNYKYTKTGLLKLMSQKIDVSKPINDI